MRVVSILLLCWMVLVACADEDNAQPQSESTVVVATPVEAIAFPQFKEPAEAYMQALLQGMLLVEDGCLRVGDATQSYLIIWPVEFSVATNNAGELVVIDGLGNSVAQVDQSISLGGGEVRMIDESLLQAPLPACSGPYWIASP